MEDEENMINENVPENYESDNLISLDATEENLLTKILENIEKRYMAKDNKSKNIYSFIGYKILIAINPYGNMNEIRNLYYTKENKNYYKDYFDKNKNNPPKAHIYYLIEDAFRSMLKNEKRQNFIITGDSGSGKTESTNLILEYITCSGSDEINKNIMDSNPLLEAFGNAKTLRSDNSTRFGKFIEINFSKDGKILDAIIESYLLEKSRVVQVQEGEENFKIFYQFILGRNEEEEKKYRIKSVDYYKYLRNEKNKENKQYEEDFAKIKQCFINFNFSVEDIDNIFKILSGILYLGNIEFINKNNQIGLDIEDKNIEDLKNASEFLGLKFEDLKKILTQKYKPIIQSFEYYDEKKAESMRDSIAKELYSKLFDYIIKKINEKIQKNHDVNNKYQITILDIFGFANFDENYFEQLYINYANERLQQFFNNEVLKLELMEYKNEGINFDKIEYFDNMKVIELMDKKRGGSIFSYLKDSLFHPNENNRDQFFRKTFYDNLFLKSINKKDLVKPILESDTLKYSQREKDSLYIKHYAGTVKYNVKDMVKKNISYLNNDIKKALQISDNTLIKKLYKDEIIVKADKFNGKTITELFRDQLNNLFEKFKNSDNRYIKCIKPNEEKKENYFDRKIVEKQMIYGGIKAAFHIKKSGYPIHKKKEDFIKEYKLLFPDLTNELFDNKITNEIARIGNNKFNNLYQIGKTKFFMKEELKNSLDKILNEKINGNKKI